MFFVHQATFCVNSLAHTFGVQTYSKEHTSYDHIITALVSFGEGYHNYHLPSALIQRCERPPRTLWTI